MYLGSLEMELKSSLDSVLLVAPSPRLKHLFWGISSQTYLISFECQGPPVRLLRHNVCVFTACLFYNRGINPQLLMHSLHSRERELNRGDKVARARVGREQQPNKTVGSRSERTSCSLSLSLFLSLFLLVFSLLFSMDR